ncbi:branched-chain amino acid ABC transporter permease [Noviherbaspirillum sp. L7-7A]|uniref:branched-chain amino acid ABC transporter permease n=1 Tax=Noviherbaspirillum sp. L7-7A TaxID=2850560 RepID=UPI001C2BF938|nr:branched-chain amino acid ABC transporter permease [Noviherbaspirillum sp. L7-7A]MBV0881524.1 branched-chain amino acid ABC transporter permease [Noviherbaspirillum sp. L7-7A]
MSARRFDLAIAVLIGATVIALPFATQNDFFLNLALLVMIWSIFALGFDLVFGSIGMVSFGHASFLGMGGYIVAIFTQRYGWSFEASTMAAMAAASLLAWIFSFFALRVSGIFFSLVTLALSQLLYILADSKLRELTGGADGIAGVTRPQLFGVDFFTTQAFYWYVVVLFTIVVACVAMLRASPFGRVMQGVAQNEIRTEQLGYDVHGIKQITFLVSGGISGLASALLASLLMFVNPQMLHWTTSGDVIIMTLLGGAGTLWGPVGGVILFELLKEWLSGQTQYWYGVLGVVFILATIYFPKGFLGEARRLATRAQRRKP